MNKQTIKLVGLTIFLLTVYFVVATAVWSSRATVRRTSPADYVLPSGLSRLLALEHRGVFADYLFLRLITFYGERSMYGQELDDSDWRYIERNLENVTDLDGHFRDAYLFGESLLAWDAGRPKAANTFLLKGMNYRKDDWILPFYIGANNLLFLKDNEGASRYFMEASRRPGSPDFVATLAARTGYYAGQSKTAILFLEGLIAETTDKNMRKKLEKRKAALVGADIIEDALRKYRDKFGALPADLSLLISSRYLPVLPPEPYGGQWIMLENGRVYSSSKFVDMKVETPLP